jgi:hypothetical protein
MGAAPLHRLPSVPATDTAFFVLFGIFVVAFAVLAVITVTWAIRRDRAGRADWARRREDEPPRSPGP